MWPHRQQPTRLPRSWDSPGKKTGMGCHFLLQRMKMKSLSGVWLLAPHGLQPTRLLRPWDFPGKSTGVGCHLLACEMSAIVWWFEHSLALPFFGIGMKTDLFQSYGHCWVFQICCHIECSTFTAPSFRIWNSSTGVPSPPLALFVVMLLEAYFTSH